MPPRTACRLLASGTPCPQWREGSRLGRAPSPFPSSHTGLPPGWAGEPGGPAPGPSQSPSARPEARQLPSAFLQRRPSLAVGAQRHSQCPGEPSGCHEACGLGWFLLPRVPGPREQRAGPLTPGTWLCPHLSASAHLLLCGDAVPWVCLPRMSAPTAAALSSEPPGEFGPWLGTPQPQPSARPCSDGWGLPLLAAVL